jgi:hypothetical protein
MKSNFYALGFFAGLLFAVSPQLFAAPKPPITDPYKYVWDNDEGSVSGLVRFFLDINGDKIPDLFVGAKSLMGTGGGVFHVFTLNQNHEYTYLGKIDVNPGAIQMLSSVHHGIHDIKGYWHMSAFDGDLNQFAFNGKTFEKTNTKKIKSADFAKNISPGKITTEESGPNLNWKP